MTEVTTEHPNGPAPTTMPSGRPGETFALGGKGGRTAQAWQHVWDHLSRTEFRPGHELVQAAATAYGLKPVTITAMLVRMASSGVLEQQMIPLPVTYARGKGFTAQRKRVHYRIATDE